MMPSTRPEAFPLAAPSALSSTRSLLSIPERIRHFSAKISASCRSPTESLKYSVFRRTFSKNSVTIPVELRASLRNFTIHLSRERTRAVIPKAGIRLIRANSGLIPSITTRIAMLRTIPGSCR